MISVIQQITHNDLWMYIKFDKISPLQQTVFIPNFKFSLLKKGASNFLGLSEKCFGTSDLRAD